MPIADHSLNKETQKNKKAQNCEKGWKIHTFVSPPTIPLES